MNFNVEIMIEVEYNLTNEISILSINMFTEKRHFKRYPRESELHLRFKERYFKAILQDYSFEGLNALLLMKPVINIGDILYCEVEKPELKGEGEVRWINESGSRLKIGIRKVGQLKGHIKDFRFSDTFIGLQRSQKTGILNAQFKDISKKVYVKKGDMIFSASNYAYDRLDYRLVRDKVITPEQCRKAVAEMKRTGQRLGYVLVQLGYLKPEELYKIIRSQIEDTIMSLFAFEEGWFEFNEGAFFDNEVITLRLSGANIIYYGIKGIKDFMRIRSELPPLESILYFSSDPLNIFQDLRLDDAGKRIISSIDNRASIKEIILSSKLDHSDAIRTIYALLRVRMLTTSPFIEITKDDIEEAFEKSIDPGTVEMIEDMYQRYESIGYYRVLGLKENASESEIKKAFYRTAKRFHPDLYFSLSDSHEPLKNKLSSIFSYVNEAYTTLSDPQKRSEYDRAISLKSLRRPPSKDESTVKFILGKRHLMEGNYTTAEFLLNQAIYFNEKMPQYHYYLGLSLLKQNKPKDAIKPIERAVELAPYNADYMAELGWIYYSLGSKGRARTLFEKALKISPDNARALEGMGSINKE